MRKLGLDRMLQGRTQVERRVRNLIEAMIIQRIIAPGSKLAFHRALAADTATSSLAQSVGLTDVAEREVYAALDWLIEQQPRIEAALARKHLVDGTLVLYDVSSSYMEGRRCPLARYGHSRDHRADRPQIVYGLLCATDGTPVAIEVFEGDTALLPGFQRDRPVAGYDYSIDWTPMLAGLSPARMTAKLAARPTTDMAASMNGSHTAFNDTWRIHQYPLSQSAGNLETARLCICMSRKCSAE